MGMFDTLRRGLTRTREGFVQTLAQIVLNRPPINDELLEQLEETLIAGDVGVAASTRIIEHVRAKLKENPDLRGGDLAAILRDEIVAGLPAGSAPEAPSIPDLPRPYVIMVVGINGVGKTTTIGKLAARLIGEGKKVTIAAADTFRAAANEQLEIWASRAGAHLVRQDQGSDPAAVAFDAVSSATSRGSDVVIIDTAGRLHTKINLMEELKKIRRVIQKKEPSAPHEVLLVLDASTGQNGIQQARQFSSAVGVTGVVLTKLDGTARGGIVLAIAHELGIPVRFIGVGEKVEDLQPFDRASFVEALFAQ
jgi:fused signal recognition particle receptor